MNVAELGLVRQGGEDVLVCPACGGENLHQLYAQVVMRQREDEVKPLAVYVDRSGVSAARAQEKRTRRDAVRIHFRCEHCPQMSCLEILQHKGQTLISMKEATE